MEASISTLILSIGSSAAMSLGLEENPESKKIEKNLPMAKFNIDLLMTLKEKTEGNLNEDESKLLERILADLQLRFVESSKEA